MRRPAPAFAAGCHPLTRLPWPIPCIPRRNIQPSCPCPALDSGFAPRVKAVLGPTNTGKTHLAIERMLAHASGIIGFPLRLLARENYDRMVAQKGARHVALITGEEKIVPPDARWFSCTVEAMPLDRDAEFLAVDEIQLCADPDRGHVFTDRLLHARGMVETMFLGAETIRPLLQRLVPQASVETRPRLSQLSHAGPAKLVRLPPRSAVVAFSAAEVYAIAELIRRRRGGCAVVMGRLSPRTRNAQVALYQDKEVDFLVATDAIGMGLNMDVDHVAFAALGKFDGHRPRRLTRGRGGADRRPRRARHARRHVRHHRDTARRWPTTWRQRWRRTASRPLDQLCWRNSDLDLTHVDALLATLMAPPPGPGLVKGNDAADLETLAALARDPEIRRLAQRPAHGAPAVGGLPDPRFPQAGGRHAHQALRPGVRPHRARRASADRLAGRADRRAGPRRRRHRHADAAARRRAGLVLHRRARRLGAGQRRTGRAARARSRTCCPDALHERLTSRFVDRRAAHLMRRLEAGETQDLLSAVTRRGEVIVEGHPVGRIGGFSFVPDPAAEGDEKKLVLRAARRALREEMPRRVAVVETAPDAAFALGRRPRAGLGRRADRAAEARRQRAAAARADAGQRVPRRRAARAAAHQAAALPGRHRCAHDLAPLLAAAAGRGSRPGVSRPAASADRGARPDPRRRRRRHCRRRRAPR